MYHVGQAQIGIHFKEFDGRILMPYYHNSLIKTTHAAGVVVPSPEMVTGSLSASPDFSKCNVRSVLSLVSACMDGMSGMSATNFMDFFISRRKLPHSIKKQMKGIERVTSYGAHAFGLLLDPRVARFVPFYSKANRESTGLHYKSLPLVSL